MSKFNDIILKTKTVSEKTQRGYRVYTDKTNFQTVEAATVSEAMEKSGIKNPVRIEVAGIITKSIFSKAELAEMQRSPVQTQQPVQSSIPPAPDSAGTTTPAN